MVDLLLAAAAAVTPICSGFGMIPEAMPGDDYQTLMLYTLQSQRHAPRIRKFIQNLLQVGFAYKRVWALDGQQLLIRPEEGTAYTSLVAQPASPPLVGPCLTISELQVSPIDVQSNVDVPWSIMWNQYLLCHKGSTIMFVS